MRLVCDLSSPSCRIQTIMNDKYNSRKPKPDIKFK
uniref:Uncharacterized protein n=1 Tax=Rhizophora mucronata TaxID=61149 RepID=A0A2P2JIT4_RHIMU